MRPKLNLKAISDAELPRRLPELLHQSRRVEVDLVMNLAVTEKLERLEARRFGKTKASRNRLAEKDAKSPQKSPAGKGTSRRNLTGGRTKTSSESLARADGTPHSRYIPAAVRRTVSKRDGGRCTYRDQRGRQNRVPASS